MEKQKEKIYDIYLRTRIFSVSILKFCRELRKQSVEYFLRDQLARSGTSIGANIHEGKGSTSKRELRRFYEIALRSGYETDYWLNILKETNDSKSIELLQTELTELRKIIASIILKLKKEDNS